MSFELQVKPIAFYSGIASSTDLEHGNKVILPTDVLNELSNEHKDNLVYPLVFKVKNENGKEFAVGVKDFSANADNIYLPKRLMEDNWVPYDSKVQLTYITPPKGKLVKLQPHKTKFTMLSNPKVVLEKGIIENYPVLTCGETLSVRYNGETYLINVLESEPENIISTFNTDLSVDFAQPLDYDEYQRKEQEKKILEKTEQNRNRVRMGINRYQDDESESRDNNYGSNSFTQFLNQIPNEFQESEETDKSFVAFSGKGYKLGGF